MNLDFVAGAVTMGYLVCALMFFRFWRRTRDGLFAAFALAFTLLGANQALAALLNLGRDEAGWIWLLRVAAFLAIIAAIVGKNMRPRSRDRLTADD